MTKHEADVIGGLNMTDQISNEAYKQIMIAAQDENEVGDVLDNIIAEMGRCKTWHEMQLSERDTKGKLLISDIFCHVVEILDRYRNEVSE